jgi:DNA replication protein DnaC
MKPLTYAERYPKIRTCQCGVSYEVRYCTTAGITVPLTSACPACTQKAIAQEQAADAEKQRLDIIQRRETQRQLSGIPANLWEKRIDNFESGWQDKALKTCKAYAENFPVGCRPKGYRSLLLYSAKDNPGTGKSHLSAAIMHRILDRWVDGNTRCQRLLFVSEPELFLDIRNTYSFDRKEVQTKDDESDIIKKLIWADLLVLDDVGKVNTNNRDFVEKTLFTIIYGRYSNELPMIISTNLKPEALEKYTGKPAFDRLFQMVKGEYLVMDGKSYRRKGLDTK